MRRLILGLVVAIVAICGSAFKSAPKKANLANAYFVLDTPGTYNYYGTSAPSESACEREQPNKCVIGFDSRPPLDTYPANSLPSTPIYQSTNFGLWNEP